MVMSKPFYISLPNRGCVTLTGEDRIPFLNGLVTNDVTGADDKHLIYACLLTPQGKFLHDFFVWDDAKTLFLECEGGDRAKDLATILTKYRLRAKVAVESQESLPVFAIFNTENFGLPDPRHAALGRRSYTKPDAMDKKDFEFWDKIRIEHAIPDGSRDLEIGRSILLEYGIDHLNGIDFNKGCYMGQELTARTHYRALIKKRLYTVRLSGAVPAPFTEPYEGVSMRSSCGDMGLAVMKDDARRESL
jgi:tRNA-modifying protein YgfZ